MKVEAVVYHAGRARALADEGDWPGSLGALSDAIEALDERVTSSVLLEESPSLTGVLKKIESTGYGGTGMRWKMRVDNHSISVFDAAKALELEALVGKYVKVWFTQSGDMRQYKNLEYIEEFK